MGVSIDKFSTNGSQPTNNLDFDFGMHCKINLLCNLHSLGCEEVAHKGYPSGVYTLKINNIQMVGYCEINSRDGQAWLVIQRRHQGDISFYR